MGIGAAVGSGPGGLKIFSGAPACAEPCFCPTTAADRRRKNRDEPPGTGAADRSSARPPAWCLVNHGPAFGRALVRRAATRRAPCSRDRATDRALTPSPRGLQSDLPRVGPGSGRLHRRDRFERGDGHERVPDGVRRLLPALAAACGAHPPRSCRLCIMAHTLRIASARRITAVVCVALFVPSWAPAQCGEQPG